MTPDEIQAEHDTFYWKNGKCCAGCDYWRSSDIFLGECLMSKIITAKERLQMIGLENCTMEFEAGHALTKRDYVCGKFKDDFDWSKLSVFYLKRIGARK